MTAEPPTTCHIDYLDLYPSGSLVMPLLKCLQGCTRTQDLPAVQDVGESVYALILAYFQAFPSAESIFEFFELLVSSLRS